MQKHCDEQLLVFSLEGHLYAISLEPVECVVLIPEISSLPEMPPAMAGIFMLRGEPVPVIDLRCRFGFVHRRPELSDNLVILRIRGYRVALWVDGTHGVRSVSALAEVESEKIWPGLEFLHGVASSDAEIIGILNPDRLVDGLPLPVPHPAV